MSDTSPDPKPLTDMLAEIEKRHEFEEIHTIRAPGMLADAHNDRATLLATITTLRASLGEAEKRAAHERGSADIAAKARHEAEGLVAVLREALKRADQFITNGIELGFIKMPDEGSDDPALETPGIIRAALSTTPARTPEWQPIDTAPKTGDDLMEKCFLGYCTDDHPNDRLKVCWWEPKLKGGIWWSDADVEAHPTHWMPLPTAPETITRPAAEGT